MRRSPLLATTVLAGLTLSATAYAQVTTVDDDGALQILTGLKTWITENLLVPEMEISLQFDGPISVQPEGDRYRVDIPSSTIGDEWGNGVRIEAVEATLAPTPRGWFDMTVRLPDQLVVVDEYEGPVAEMTIGDQRAAGLFVPQIETFLSLDLLLEAIRFAPYNEPGELTIGQMTIVGDTTEDATGLAVMDFDGRIRDMRLTGVPDVQFGLDEVIFDYDFDGVPLDDFIEFTARLYEIEDRFYEALRDHRSLQALDTFEPFEDMAALISATPPLMSSLAFEFGLQGLSVTPEGAPAPVTLGGTRLRLESSGLDGDASRVGLLMEMESLNGAGIPFVGTMLPTYALLDAEVLGIPNDALVAALIQWLNEAMSIGPDLAGELALAGLAEAVVEGGAELRLNALEVYAEAMSLKVDGTLEPDPTGLIPVRFEATVELGGLPTARMAMLPWIQDDDAAQGFDLLESLGEPVTDDRGESVLRYELASTPEGGVTINGQDAEALFDALD